MPGEIGINQGKKVIPISSKFLQNDVKKPVHNRYEKKTRNENPLTRISAKGKWARKIKQSKNDPFASFGSVDENAARRFTIESQAEEQNLPSQCKKKINTQDANSILQSVTNQIQEKKVAETPNTDQENQDPNIVLQINSTTEHIQLRKKPSTTETETETTVLEKVEIENTNIKETSTQEEENKDVPVILEEQESKNIKPIEDEVTNNLQNSNQSEVTEVIEAIDQIVEDCPAEQSLEIDYFQEEPNCLSRSEIYETALNNFSNAFDFVVELYEELKIEEDNNNNTEKNENLNQNEIELKNHLSNFQDHFLNLKNNLNNLIPIEEKKLNQNIELNEDTILPLLDKYSKILIETVKNKSENI